MDVRGEAASLSVQEAMKTLNMTTFTAEELNTKFQYRVQSITRGLGGSLECQKNVYTAWEYLNRMLVRETSNQTEEVLKKVDKTVKMLEKPKQLDMIPVRLNNASKKASLIIQKDTEPDEENNSRNRRVRENSLKKKANKMTGEEKREDPEKSLGVSALPGQLLQKHIKWIEQDRAKSKEQNKEVKVKRLVQEKTVDRKAGLARLNNAAQKRPKKDPTTMQLKEIIRMDRTVRSIKQDRNVTEKQEQLGEMLEKLPKLPRTQSQALLFKKTTALNEMFENPRKPSRYDQWSSAKRAAWKEKANQILSERPDSAKRPKSGAKIKSRKTARRSVSKQPVEQMLYRKPNLEQARASEVANAKATLASIDNKHVPHPGRPKDSPRFIKPELARPTDNPNLLAHGPFTPSRILKWIKSTQNQDRGT